jgi:FkbM family methyltransferase
MKKVFIDCGYHLGEGMSQFISALGIDDTWEIHTFEPNPMCHAGDKIHLHNLPIHYHNAAVWIENKKMLFNQEHRNSTGSPIENSTHEWDGHGSCLMVLESKHSVVNQVEVDAIDFAEFLEQFRGMDVYCKMDIEGAEFAVLRHLIKTDTISIIKNLWTEWHTYDLATETGESQGELFFSVKRYTNIHGS